jgi:hypothetical protein
MMAMAWEQWLEIVARLNACWPDQQIEPTTAHEWYDDLKARDAGDIWLAVRRLRTEQRWRPNLAEIVVAYKAHRAEMAAQARHLQLHAGGRGTPMPPETRQAWEILQETLPPHTTPEQKAEARMMIDALAGELAARTHTMPPEEAASA